VRWVPDRTGRFAQRPHYEPAELDLECERIITGFLRERNGNVVFPIETDDLIVLLEREAADVDIYADLSGEGLDVEGVTYFRPSGKPDVRIARRLAEEPHAIHRFRTTSTHELGHVTFHNVLWITDTSSGDLFPEDSIHAKSAASPRCRRESMQPIARTDWMEWQAGYACGAFLMPLTHLKHLVADLRAKKGWLDRPQVASVEAGHLLNEVAQRFDVSTDAARVRLIQLELLVAQESTSGALFGG
jgi:Zn-dependent peptidase ImmA (M78 family)